MRRLLRSFLFLFVLGLAGLAAGGYWLWTRVQEPYRTFLGEQFVAVPQGASTREIARRLASAGVIADPWTFRAALYWTGRARVLKAGEYRFDRALSPLQVVDTLARGETYEVHVTFPEGLTIDEMAGIFETHGLGTAAAFREAARDVSAIASLDPAARDLEGYVFPETYAVPRRVSAATLVASMVERFKAVYAEASAGHAGDTLTTRQLVTLASLIEKETASADERPLVSAVYRNRLKIGMGMQADPTVVYALRKAGRYRGNIRKDDLQMDSPYNTYRYRGLPPGPIAAPGKASIEAALAPADSPYLYFVSRNDGTHVFAETLKQHNANVQRFQVEFFRRQSRR